MPTRRAAVGPEPEADVAVTGEVVTVDAVIPSPAEQNAQADRARGRTYLQVGIPGALVVIGEWVARLANWDLDPSADGTGLPADVSAAIIVIVTALLAVRMNPKRPS